MNFEGGLSGAWRASWRSRRRAQPDQSSPHLHTVDDESNQQIDELKEGLVSMFFPQPPNLVRLMQPTPATTLFYP